MGDGNFLKQSIFAHKGIYNNITIHENTLESVMYAAKNNLSLEIDVRMTKDKKLIVFHDEDMSRLLKLKDKVSSINYADLEYISYFHIPPLKEVLDAVNNSVPILLDIKDDIKLAKNELLQMLQNYKGNIAIQSYDYDTVKFFKKKNFVSGLVISNKKNKEYLNKNIDVDFLSIQYDCLDTLSVKALKKDYKMLGWVLDNREDVEYYIKIYDNLIIDNIEEVFK